MTKNRDYTGLVRTPSSMAWLIRRRGAVQGLIDKYHQQQQKLPDQIAKAEAELAALDQVIPLHEVKVDPSTIKGTRQKSAPVAAYGELTSFILKNLRETGHTPLCTKTLTNLFLQNKDMPITTTNTTRVGTAMRNRLKKMSDGGIVVAHHDRTPTGGAGLWTLHPKFFED